MPSTNSPVLSSAISSFADLDLRATTHAALNRVNITVPTPIQAGSLPVLLAGRDLIGQSRFDVLSALMEVPLGPHRLKAALGYSAQGYERFLFGEALTAQGRDDEVPPNLEDRSRTRICYTRVVQGC